ncbi:MAG: hypothetical protein KDE53_39845, partial [Caldilineaceae bacterium]|nr:hypothetical protein [Caldilineaceae bacterium]
NPATVLRFQLPGTAVLACSHSLCKYREAIENHQLCKQTGVAYFISTAFREITSYYPLRSRFAEQLPTVFALLHY